MVNVWRRVTIDFNAVPTIKGKPSLRSSTQPKAMLKSEKRDSIQMGAVKFNFKIINRLKVLNIFPNDSNICI